MGTYQFPPTSFNHAHEGCPPPFMDYVENYVVRGNVISFDLRDNCEYVSNPKEEGNTYQCLLPF